MIIACCLLLCCLPLLATPLMVMTDPMGADIYLNGELLTSPSPAIVRLAEGEPYRLRLIADGYHELTLNLTAGSEAVPEIIDHDFTPDSVELFRAGSGNPDETRVQQFDFTGYKQIQLQLTPDGPGNPRPLYPRTKLLNFSDIGLPVLTLLTGMLVLNDLYHPPADDGVISADLIGAGGALTALLGLNLYLHREEERFYRSYTPPTIALNRTRYGAYRRFSNAQRLITAEAYQTAEQELQALIDETPKSRYVPRALYSLSRIALQRGDLENSEHFLNQIITRYPDPTVYDRACKNLADVLIATERSAEALMVLEKMVFADETYAPEIIDQFKASLISDLAAESS